MSPPNVAITHYVLHVSLIKGQWPHMSGSHIHVHLPKYHCTQVPWKSINVCWCSNHLCISWLLKVHWPQMTPRWPLTPSLMGWHVPHHLGIIRSKFHCNPSKHVCITSQKLQGQQCWPHTDSHTHIHTHTHTYGAHFIVPFPKFFRRGQKPLYRYIVFASCIISAAKHHESIFECRLMQCM